MSMVIHLASRRAAPTTPIEGDYATHQQAYADVSNALSMARYYMQHGNFAAAQRKMAQGLAAVRNLLPVEGAE